MLQNSFQAHFDVDTLVVHRLNIDEWLLRIIKNHKNQPSSIEAIDESWLDIMVEDNGLKTIREALVSNQVIHHKKCKDRTILSYIDKIWLEVVLPDHNKRIIGEGFVELEAISHIKPYGRTLLSYCVQYGYEDLVAKLLKYNIDPDVTFHSHLTPLFFAIAKGNFKIANQLTTSMYASTLMLYVLHVFMQYQ